jgi:hypothetical protein
VVGDKGEEEEERRRGWDRGRAGERGRGPVMEGARRCQRRRGAVSRDNCLQKEEEVMSNKEGLSQFRQVE